MAVEASQLGGGSTAIVITPSTDTSWVGAVRDLKRKGIGVVAVHLEASTFGDAASSLEVVASLAASRVPTYLVRNGLPLGESFSQKTGIDR
jgi:ABC-type sugar transport system substrate-binding protein